MELNFLVKRNILFGKRVKDLIKGNKLFIAIGASHLGGKTGLLNQFKEAGFKIKPMRGLD